MAEHMNQDSDELLSTRTIRATIPKVGFSHGPSRRFGIMSRQLLTSATTKFIVNGELPEF